MPRTRQPRQSARAASTQRAAARSSKGKQYLCALIEEQELANAEDVKRALDVDNDFDDDGSMLSLAELMDLSDDSTSEQSCG